MMDVITLRNRRLNGCDQEAFQRIECVMHFLPMRWQWRVGRGGQRQRGSQIKNESAVFQRCSADRMGHGHGVTPLVEGVRHPETNRGGGRYAVGLPANGQAALRPRAPPAIRLAVTPDDTRA